MPKISTRLVLVALLFLSSYLSKSQTVITQWNFNSVSPDANTGTGSTISSTGSGSIANIGGTTASFASGAANGGSSDPSTTDNSGWGLTTFPAQSTNNKTAGISFTASTAGYQNITVSFDLRHSNTGPRNLQFQYSTDGTTWVDFDLDTATGGDAWSARSYNLSSVAALSNNPNAAFRVVAAFDPTSGTYLASNPASSYATTGTWRFDMVTVRGTSTGGGDVTAPVAQSYQVISATTSFIKFSEVVASATATNVSNYVFNPSLTVNSATLSASGDTVFLTHAPFVNGQRYTLTVSGVQDAAMNTMASTNFNAVYNTSIPNLVITEIIHSPNDVEMIEVYNAGTSAINLGGLKWTNGTTGNFPEVSLAAGATAVFSTSPSTASSTLKVSPVYTILNGLGSADDILVIRNSLNQIIDSVSYFVGTNGWPTAPTGVYAYSYELNAAANDNNNGSNWSVPQNTVTPQPSQGVIRATPGVYPTPAFTPASANVSFVGTKTFVNESTSTVNIVAKLTGGGSSPSSIDIEVLPLATAASNSDYTLPASHKFEWAANANDVSDTIVVTINNDAFSENAEYFIVRFANPVNIELPPVASNHFTVSILDNDIEAPVATQSIQLNHVASFSNGAAGTNSAEIVAHDPVSQRLFIANSIAAKIDIVSFKNPAAATLINSISVTPYGNINSIAVKNGIVAAAIENATPELPGKVVFFDTTGAFISQVEVGAMPDMITFNNAGTRVLTANEGQPRGDYAVDPEGSVSIINIAGSVAGITQAAVTTASFAPFNGQATSLRAAGVRLFGLNNPTVAQDMEPEYITISSDDQTAYVTCQENNAVATINLSTSAIVNIQPLGTKDHSATRNALDVGDQGTTIEIANWPVKGVFMPDAIASYSVGGQTYLVTANEGDAREYSAYEEAIRVSSSAYPLDPTKFPNADALKANIGRLNVTKASGDIDGDGDYDEIHTFGARSISIWNASNGTLVWDSGEELELITAKHPVYFPIFNASNANNTLKNRSDDKGPEPEGVAVAQIAGRTYAFIALERTGGCMVYDITNPSSPVYVDYKNTRNVASYGGDNGAEGIVYIEAGNSPNGLPMVILANEVSSTLSFYNVNATVLDITLADIKAANLGNSNRIDWSTVTEVPGDEFEIQRSVNGNSFKSFAIVKSTGRASSYQIKDEQPFDGLSYYRIKLKHLSGNTTYSPVVTATKRTGQAIVNIFPNPVQNAFTITVADNRLINTNVTIVDIKGVVVKSLRLAAQTTTVDMSAMPSGIYTVRFMDGTMKSLKLVKQ